VARKAQKGLNPELESAISAMLKVVMADQTATLTDKCKVLDRALALEKIKQKILDDDWGSGFGKIDDDEGED